MRIQVLTAAAVALATADQVREHLRLDASVPVDADEYLNGLVEAATRAAENHCNRQFLTAQLQVDYRAWPGGVWRLPRGEVQEFNDDAISYLTAEKLDSIADTRNAALIETADMDTLPVAAYTASASKRYGYTIRVHELPGDALADSDSAVRVVYRAGYGDAADDVPEVVRIAVLQLVGDLYENREASAMTMIHENPTTRRMLDLERIDPLTVQST